MLRYVALLIGLPMFAWLYMQTLAVVVGYAGALAFPPW
jgi:hypothetical protein